MTERDGGSVAWLHASAVVVGETGILIRGPAGAGKTSLALALVAESRLAGRFGRLVADDAVALRALGARLVARPHPRTAGMAERRGIGVVAVEHEPACVIRLVVDLAAPTGDTAPIPRLPEPEDLRTTLLGVELSRLTLRAEASTRDNTCRVLDCCPMFRPGS